MTNRPDRERIDAENRRRSTPSAADAGGILLCQKRLESIRRLRYHSLPDAVLLARHLCDSLADLGGPTDSPTRARLSAVRERLDGYVDEQALGPVIRELRVVLWQVEAANADEAGLSTWVRRQQPRRLVFAGVVVLMVALAIVVSVSIRSRDQLEAVAHYDELQKKADELLFAGKTEEAVGAYRAALAVLPDHQSSAVSYNNLGWSLQQLGRLDEAIAAYEDAVRLDPDADRPRNNLVAAQRLKGR